MQAKAETYQPPVKSRRGLAEMLHNIKASDAFLEILFAACSGALILTGWILSRLEVSTFSVISFLFAYGIGGYYKAKEGLLDTIETKKLNVELLMVLAAIGSAIIGYWEEGAILIFIFAVSGALETYTMSKSHKELTALMDLQPKEAWLIKDGREYRVSVEELSVGDYILVKPGEQIPSDGVISFGNTSIDESAITGESIPVEKKIKDEVFAGTVNGSGSITIEITKPNSETLFQKIITMVQNAQSEKSPSQQFLDRFEGKYVNIVLVAVGLMMFLPHYLLDWTWNETLYRAMVLLVVASPCAVVASITPATLSAISNGARNGILLKGGVHLENMAVLKAIAFDKTGTLTRGKPEVTDLVMDENWDEKEILQVVASIENHSNHPLAQAIVRYATEAKKLDLMNPGLVEDVSGWGVKATATDSLWKIGKQKFMDGNFGKIDDRLIQSLASSGKTMVFIQKDDQVVGLIALKDVVREESKKAVSDLMQLGIQPIMLTGDNPNTANAIANEIGIHHYIAECLPENKVKELKQLQDQYQSVAMVGDGINDAPALAAATVGIAMGEGTDVALETADVVLMKSDLSKLSKIVQLSKRMSTIVKQNLIFSVAVILTLVTTNFIQGVDLPLGVLGHEGSTILVILNSLRLLKS